MHEFSHSLGDAVKRARSELGLTQSQVAEKINVDVRTVMNIENYKANPKMEVLFPLIRALKIDPNEIFNPEMQRKDPSIQRLRIIIETCNAQEAAALIPAIESILSVLRTDKDIKIK